ncbi:cellulose binding domain-containing protein [Asanoa sp. WMMD1127]|uniref:GH12 family glycosyl hydrolase domain-containing protein n=1 Tax=Asanoa sp. WMMD1127 TaxID=3016107 RepID=UPI0024167C71|nr:cellulose binding domain-containing protein [Asanoa sp. WMMD1127]MDG4820656.1 cellulose binding domain-containing protein [Asanoa sp. WMMD1127]
MRRLVRAVVTAALVAFGTLVITSPAQADTQICEQYGSTTIQGRYVVQNNRWGSTAQQCINVTDTGFSITAQQGSAATNGAPLSYPSVFLGCHYTNCSPGTNLPIQVSQISSATSSINYTYASGTYNASYDIWLDPTPRTDGVSQMEIMIWFNRQGPIQPIGSVVGSATVGGRTWEVWRGSNGANNVISYVAPSPITSWNFSVLDFINDVRSRGAITNSWYLTSIQAGFEPWNGGVGLGVSSFSATVNGGGTGPGPDSQAPSTPGQPTAGTVTASSVALSWAASTDNVGVTGYDVYRQQGSGTATLAGSTTGTSFTASGLSASTAYTFTVRARDAAGNVSASSPGRTVTTSGSGSGGGACRVRYAANAWNNGFTADVTVTNTGTSTVNGWTLTYTLPSGQAITSTWNATVTTSGSAVTARNISWNGTLAPGASTSFGYQGTHGGSYSSPSAFALNGSACTVG